MKYIVDKEKFKNILKSRPALIKTVQNLTKYVARELIKDKAYINTDMYNYLPEELKRDKVLAKMILLGSRWVSNDTISQEVFDSLTPAERKSVIKTSEQTITKFKNVTEDEYLLAIENGFYEIRSLPEELLTDRVLLALAGKKNLSYIPESVWNRPNAQTLLIDLIKLDPSIFNICPEKILTKEALEVFIMSDSALDREDIPYSFWNEALALKAVTNCVSNIEHIPHNFITEEIACIAAKGGVIIPRTKFNTYDVYMYYVSHSLYIRGESVPHNLLKNKEFQIKVAGEGGVTGIKNIIDEGILIGPDRWVELLKVCPSLIRYIEKKDQTCEIVEAFLSSATKEIIDEKASFINLTKIRKEHAPLLIGCESSIIVTTINRYLVKDPGEKTDNTLEIEMSPGNFAAIKGLL